ncbi:MAG: MFS transporter [Spirochaetota bacterium]|nr:MFS transporter [Spirochaetota bacterium]
MSVSYGSCSRKLPPLIGTFRRSPLAGSGIFISGLIFGISWSLIPRYGQQVYLTEAHIGLLMLLISVGTLLFQWPLGWLSDREGRRKAIILSSVVSFTIALFIAVTGASGFLIFPLILLFGGFSTPLYSLCVALMNDQLSRDEMVQAAGAIVVYYGTGSALGPIVGGYFMAHLGPSGLFYSIALPLALYLIFVFLNKRLAKKLPVTERRNFKIYLRTTTIAFQVLGKVKRPLKRNKEK